jgi:pimeloyl-ACP methyl ester carboxylesterase
MTVDLRGHGLSDKPSDPQFYTEGKRWGEDLNTVIQAANLKSPVLIGWSIGAAVITNYLENFGDSHISGVVYVGGVIKHSPGLLLDTPAGKHSLGSTDLQEHLDGTRQFLELCFFQKPTQRVFELLYANAALASPDMSSVINQISIPAESALPRITKPVLLIYGDRDAVVYYDATIGFAKNLVQHATCIVYDGVGHSPFLGACRR